MTRLKLALLASVLILSSVEGLASSSAAGQTQFDPKPTYPPSPTLEKITSYPSVHIVPVKSQPEAYDKVPPGWTPMLQMPLPQERAQNLGRLTMIKPAKFVIYNEPGGDLQEHAQRFREWAAKGDVEIRGPCNSACTLVMGFVDRDRICFGELGHLGFHKARRTNTNEVNMEATAWMIDKYPSDIQNWIERSGGINRLPVGPYWILHASDLWKMGYRKCD